MRRAVRRDARAQSLHRLHLLQPRCRQRPGPGAAAGPASAGQALVAAADAAHLPRPDQPVGKRRAVARDRAPARAQRLADPDGIAPGRRLALGGAGAAVVAGPPVRRPAADRHQRRRAGMGTTRRRLRLGTHELPAAGVARPLPRRAAVRGPSLGRHGRPADAAPPTLSRCGADVGLTAARPGQGRAGQRRPAAAPPPAAGGDGCGRHAGRAGAGHGSGAVELLAGPRRGPGQLARGSLARAGRPRAVRAGCAQHRPHRSAAVGVDGLAPGADRRSPRRSDPGDRSQPDVLGPDRLAQRRPRRLGL